MTASRQSSMAAWRICLAIVAAGVLLGACTTQPAAPAQPVDRAPAAPEAPLLNMSYNELMVTWIDNASHVLWDVEKPGFAPKNEADWLEVEDHATQLAAAGTLIQLQGAGPTDAIWVGQEGWKTNARLMSEAGKAALDAAKTRNLQSLVAANGKLVETCEGCHKQFKPELPSEGIAHQRPHSDSRKGL
jgi:Cytochrome C'